MIVLSFGIPLFMLPEKIEGVRWYNSTLGAGYFQEQIKPRISAALGGSFRLFNIYVFANFDNREVGKTKLFITGELPLGYTASHMNQVIKEIEAFLAQITGLETFVSHVSSGQYASIEITFSSDLETTALPLQVKMLLAAKALDWGGITWSIYGIGRGYNNDLNEDRPSFNIKLSGYNYEELEKQSKLIAAKLLSYSRVSKVNPNSQYNFEEQPGEQYLLNLDKRKLLERHTNFEEVSKNLNWLTKQTSPDLFLNFKEGRLPLLIKESNDENYQKWSMLNSPINILSGHKIRIDDIGNLSFERTSGSIFRENRQYLKVIGFEYNGSPVFAEKFLEEFMREAGTELPLGFTVSRLGSQTQKENRGTIYIKILTLLSVMIFFTCSILFENFKQALAIVGLIPISFIGLFLGFYIFEVTFDLGGYAAFIMLTGLVANAGIFVVNDYNYSKKLCYWSNHGRFLLKAVFYRINTIILTNSAVVVALTPFLLDANTSVFWFPFAVGTIGGIVFSTFTALVVLPVILYPKTTKGN